MGIFGKPLFRLLQSDYIFGGQFLHLLLSFESSSYVLVLIQKSALQIFSPVMSFVFSFSFTVSFEEQSCQFKRIPICFSYGSWFAAILKKSLPNLRPQIFFSYFSSASFLVFSSVQSLSRVWLCEPVDCSMPGFPVHRLHI